MSDKGKRVIYAAPADGPYNKAETREGNAGAAGILPGMVMFYNASDYVPTANAATIFGQQLLVANKNEMQTRSVDDPWTQDENMQMILPRSGEMVNVRVSTGQILDIDTPLVSDGDNLAGNVRAGLVNGTEFVLGYADEAVVTTSDNQLVRMRIA